MNIFEWRIPMDKAKKAIEEAVTFAEDRIKHDVNVSSNRIVIERGKQLLKQFGSKVTFRK